MSVLWKADSIVVIKLNGGMIRMKARYSFELKHCPFCGSSVSLTKGVIKGITMIVCGKCGATVSFMGKEDTSSALKAWNTRTDSKEE